MNRSLYHGETSSVSQPKQLPYARTIGGPKLGCGEQRQFNFDYSTSGQFPRLTGYHKYGPTFRV